MELKVLVNGEPCSPLNEIKCKVLANDVADLESDMKRRIEWVYHHKYKQCMKRLRNEWMPKLKGRVESVPLDDDAFAQLVFSQPDYKDRKARDLANVPAERVVP